MTKGSHIDLERAFGVTESYEEQEKTASTMDKPAKDDLGESLLLPQKKPVWETISPEERVTVFRFADEYKQFLNDARTERLAAKQIAKIAMENGFKVPNKTTPAPGDRLLFQEDGKVVALVVLGRASLTEGSKIIASHIDSPRLDLKPRPLYE